MRKNYNLSTNGDDFLLERKMCLGARKSLWLPMFLLLLLSFFSYTSMAQNSAEVRLRVHAPKGQKLRLQTEPFNACTITGATKGDYFGEYYLDEENGEIVITGRLTILECFGNKLSSLQVVRAPELAILKCYKNELVSLDLSKLPELAYLDCKENQLTSLDVSANSKLESLFTQNNKLHTLNTGHVAAIKKIDCSYNRLAGLDVKGNTGLEDLYCHNNLLTDIDLSANLKLWGLYIYSNQLKGEGMANLVRNMPSPWLAPPYFYVVDTRNPSEGNVCLMANVKVAESKGWAVYDYAGGLDNGSMKGVPYKGQDHKPLVSGHTITLTTTRQAGETITLDITGSADGVVIQGVKESAPYVGNQTYTLRGSEIIIQGDVVKLACKDNMLRSVVCSGGSALTDLDCSENQLEHLVVANETALTKLLCQKNQLSTLSVEGCTALARIDCFNNQIQAQGMTDFVTSLPTKTDNPKLFVIDTKSVVGTDGNVALKSDVQIAKGKGWDVRDWINGERWGFGDVYAGTDPRYYAITVATMEHGSIIVDHPTPNKVLAGSLVRLKAQPEEGYALISLTANDKDITQTKFIIVKENTTVKATFEKRDFYAVTLAPIKGQGTVKITGADDLQKVPSGTTLHVECNPKAGWKVAGIWAGAKDITATASFEVIEPVEVRVTFDFEGNPNEPYIVLERDIVGKLSLNYVTSSPNADVVPGVLGGEVLAYREGNLIINATEKKVVIYGDVVKLYAIYGQFVRIDVSHAPNLKDLNCAFNQLTALDLTQNKELVQFSAEINRFTELDLGGCPKLNYVNLYGNRLKGKGMTAMINSLPKRTAKDQARLIIIDTSYEKEANECMASDVQLAKAKYWMPYDLNGGLETMRPYPGKDAALEEVTTRTVKIFPNPAHEYLELSGATPGAVARLLSLAGVQIWSKPTDVQGRLRSDISTLPQGVYLLQVEEQVIKVRIE